MSAEGSKESPERQVPWPPETGVWATYPIHCHCGAISGSVKISPPLLPNQAQGKAVYEPIECLCSYCIRNGCITIHPKQSNVEWTQGIEDAVRYLTGSKKLPQLLCGKCGSSIGTDLTYFTEIGVFPEKRMSINIRMLDGVPLDEVIAQKSTIMRDNDWGYKD